MSERGIGDNAAPDIDPFLIKLEEDNRALKERQADLEIRRFGLPKTPACDEDVALINAWVVDARKLAREFEARRVEVKEPYLKRGTLIDGFFGGIRKLLQEGADAVEARSGPYLKVKQAREDAERREKARLAQEAADKARREAEEARRVQEEAAKAERERVAAAEAAARAKAQPEPEKPSGPSPEEVEAEAREAAMEAERARMALLKAEEEARKAQALAEREAAKAQKGAPVRTQVGGASAKVNPVIVGRVQNWPAVLAGLGPLGRYFTEATIQDAIDRCARDPKRPGEIPGVAFFEETQVKTTASRAR